MYRGAVIGRVSLLLVVLALAFAGCAQQLDDINRVQPNYVRKADLDGTWYMMETVTDLPSTSRATFIGETSRTEKIVWVVEENYLFAYRSYPLVPGTDEVDGGYDYADPDFYESPVAAFPILSHFDIQRVYDSSTGEQGNVIDENTSDRPWYEREYMRVDWARNDITDFDFVSGWLAMPQASYARDAERQVAGSIYFERQGDDLVYFDVPRRLLLEPDLYGCIISWPWYAWDTQDCTAAEIELVTSFAHTEPRRDYEPLPYSDQMMTRFGYFLTERYVYDPYRGVTESGRSKLIQRHNIWQQSYERDASGEFRTDGEAPHPHSLSERQVRTVPYYLSDLSRRPVAAGGRARVGLAMERHSQGRRGHGPGDEHRCRAGRVRALPQSGE
jgi:hypothetical protein